MRLLLVLLALLSGLSLTEVTASSARAEVVGAASGVVLAASHQAAASVRLAKVQRPSGEARLAPAQAVAAPAPIRAISIAISDRPRE